MCIRDSASAPNSTFEIGKDRLPPGINIEEIDGEYFLRTYGGGFPFSPDDAAFFDLGHETGYSSSEYISFS